jgi:photolyase PhrII
VVTTDPMLEHRLHTDGQVRPRPGGEFVLYWMQVTHRAHDNFALNFAIEQANALRVPVQVYHGLRHDYPWASDRFHTWILESVVDLYHDFAARGINYAFWLSRASGVFTAWPAGMRTEATREDEGLGATALVELANRAALVVTDYFPTFIVPRQVRGLRRRTETPVVAVDSATVIPMAWHRKAHATARGIRPDLMRALPDFLVGVDHPEPMVRRAIELPFDPVRPTSDTIGDLVAQCDVDHTVPRSPTFRGGTSAGRERLAAFCADGVHRYAEQRGDPNDPEAVSRLSPWLHFGNLSIHEVLLTVREAATGEHWEKFLDEALTWRELAHNLCHFDPKHRTVAAIPDWARQELAEHERDQRPVLYPLEAMEQARTAEPLWNAMQRAYLRDGWMHNALRMLWGKTVLQWTPNAAEALRVLEHLNNKYALDGRDPNSYGGILWVFGKFDRPFYRRDIYGTVRYMSLRAAEKKFDVPRLSTGSGP